ncbi:Imm49 family immunity protein [Azohydromonas lata]|uniref:Imm49 family immunity protein n=1 Tax=Azohydromonas lata TaxID=45677 RepID=UPI000833CD59|nr:Imm49 family immunity protein [Azohydromonas lata]
MPDAVEPSPRDAGLWREHARLLAWAGELRETVLAARHDDDAAQLLVVAAERAALASLDGTAEARTLAWDALREGAACGAAAALCASRTEGAALVRLADGRSRAFAVGGHAGMSAPRWALALALASCCGDGEAQRVLTHPRAVLACQEPAEVADAFWTPYCVALAALLRGEAAAAGLLRDALAALAQPPRIADPAFVTQTRAPVLRLALCLAEGAGGASQALADALAAHARWYGGGPGRGERLGLLAFELAGLCALARRQGVTLETDSPLLLPLLTPPPAGGEGEAAGQGQGQHHPGLEFVFAPRRVLGDGEPHWFLDLMGFPRAGRRHQVGTLDGGVLVADYTAEGAPGLPRSRARFALPGEGLPHTGWPPALTAVQLRALHAALLEAARGADASSAAALRDEATDVEAAIARHGQAPGGDAKATGGSPTPAQTTGGSAPAQAGEGEAADANAPHGTQAARAVALAAAAAVSAQLRPLLEALGQDRDGVLAASLRPRAGDYALAFAPAVADAARDAYEALWAEPPRVRLAVPGSRLVCHVAPAGLLGGANELSRSFPGGYRGVAALLDPHRVWVAWKLLPPGQDAGMAYDGLVWLDDHWAWFPKPYRVLAHLASPPASA